MAIRRSPFYTIFLYGISFYLIIILGFDYYFVTL